MASKNQNLDNDERALSTAGYILHRRRARMFYSLLNEEAPDALTICLDVMENLCLPETAIGQAHYSRQLYMCVFAVVVHSGVNSEQGKENVYLFTWTEAEGGKE